MPNDDRLDLSELMPGDELTINGGTGEYEFRVVAQHSGGPTGSLRRLTDDRLVMAQLVGTVPFTLDHHHFCAVFLPGLINGHCTLVVLVTGKIAAEFKFKWYDCEKFTLKRASEG